MFLAKHAWKSCPGRPQVCWVKCSSGGPSFSMSSGSHLGASHSPTFPRAHTSHIPNGQRLPHCTHSYRKMYLWQIKCVYSLDSFQWTRDEVIKTRYCLINTFVTIIENLLFDRVKQWNWNWTLSIMWNNKIFVFFLTQKNLIVFESFNACTSHHNKFLVECAVR